MHEQLDLFTHAQSFQRFWRCTHHPIATQNFFEKRTVCDLFDCHATILRWHDNGTHRSPRTPGSAVQATLQITQRN
jgi:hypothetical protein